MNEDGNNPNGIEVPSGTVFWNTWGANGPMLERPQVIAAKELSVTELLEVIQEKLDERASDGNTPELETPIPHPRHCGASEAATVCVERLSMGQQRGVEQLYAKCGRNPQG